MTAAIFTWCSQSGKNALFGLLGLAGYVFSLTVLLAVGKGSAVYIGIDSYHKEN